MTQVRWYGPTLLLLSTTLLVMLAGPRLAREIAHAQTETRIELIKDGLSQNPSLAELSHSFRRVAEVVEPSVVHIAVSAKQSSRRGHGFDDELLRKFFEGDPRFRWREDDDDRRGRGRQDKDEEDFGEFDPPQYQGNGSGWVYDHSGHIITNYHVVDDADVISVRFHDGTEMKAKVIGTDPKTDIAVIKVESDGVFPATVSESAVEQGDIVFAFGSPFRFDFSMSQGVVSAKGRQLGMLSVRGGYENFIQTDAAINPGNSGGPLTNIYGQVVGMNTAIATRTGVYNGIGFAIPVKMVTQITDQLIDRGRVSRGYLGIYIADLEPKLARTFGFDGKGVLVQDPIEGGPAVDAGIEPGDIITEVNGEPVESAEDLRHMIASFAPESELSLKVFRDGDYEEVSLTLGELPDRESLARMDGPGRHHEAEEPDQVLLKKLGIESVMPVTKDVVERFELENAGGVIARQVRPGSAADAAGIAPGHIITRVMGIDVDNAEDLVHELSKHDLVDGVRLSVTDPRRKSRRFVLLALPE